MIMIPGDMTAANAEVNARIDSERLIEEWDGSWAERFSNMDPDEQRNYLRQENKYHQQSEEKGTWYEIVRRFKDQDSITEVKGPFFEVSKLVREFERIGRNDGRELEPVPGFVVLFRNAKLGATIRAVVFSDDTLSVAESILDSIQETGTKEDGGKKNVFKRTSEAIAGQEIVFSNLEEETRVDNGFWRIIAGFGSLIGVANEKEGMGIGIVIPESGGKTEKAHMEAILKNAAAIGESLGAPFKLLVVRNLIGQVWLEKVKSGIINEPLFSRKR